MRCKECNSKIKSNVTFCPYCGEGVVVDKKADITIILDRSGSMSSVKGATIEGFNQFLSEQKKVPLPATLSLYQFDDVYEAVYENIKLKEAPLLDDKTFVPRNMTALFDAIGKTINNRFAYLESLPKSKRAKKVLICIITDGHENASREFNRSQIYDMIKNFKKDYNWQFAFVGAGIDAYKEAASFGIAKGQTMRVAATEVGVSSLFSTHSNVTSSWRSAPLDSGFSYDISTSDSAKDINYKSTAKQD